MLRGIQLTLLIGPAVPAPPPPPVTDAMTSVQVNSGRGRSGFQLTFAIGKRSPILTALLPAGYFDPIVTRVMIIVTVAGVPNVLMDGIVTRQEMAPSNEAGQSTLTVTGEDVSVAMDMEQKPSKRYPGMSEPAIVSFILAQYGRFGLVPVVVPPMFPEFPAPTAEIPTQTGTDLAYVQLLAQRHGYVFYIEPGPAPGSNIAYWGPDVRIPVPQPALSVNMDAHSNVEQLSFSLDGLAKRIVVITVYDPQTRRIPIPIPVPTINILRPPLGARLTPPARVTFPPGFSGLTAAQALARAFSIVVQASDAITGSGRLNVLRYGRVLRARQLVGVRGAGLAYDGLYYVESVTHNIRRGDYSQSFNLSRDGLISTTPTVVP